MRPLQHGYNKELPSSTLHRFLHATWSEWKNGGGALEPEDTRTLVAFDVSTNGLQSKSSPENIIKSKSVPVDVICQHILTWERLLGHPTQHVVSVPLN